MRNKSSQDRVRIDASSSARLLNRYLAYCTFTKFDDSGLPGKEKITERKSYYKIQWANLKTDLKGLLENPIQVIPQIAYSLAAFWFIFQGQHEQAINFAFGLAVAFDAGISAGSAGATSVTFAHTCTGSNLTLVTTTAYRDASTTEAGTYAGAAMTLIGSAEGTGVVRIYQFYKANPATGANNVVMSQTESLKMHCGAMSFTGTNGTVGTQATLTNTGITSASVDIASASGDMCAATAANAFPDAMSPGAGVTEVWDGAGGDIQSAGGYKAAVSATTTMAWSWADADNGGIAGVAVQQLVVTNSAFLLFMGPQPQQ